MFVYYAKTLMASFLPVSSSEDTMASPFICRLFIRVAEEKCRRMLYFQNILCTFSILLLSKYYFLQIPLASRIDTLSSRSSTLALISLTVLFTFVTLLFTSVICEVKSTSAVCSATIDSCTAETTKHADIYF